MNKDYKTCIGIFKYNIIKTLYTSISIYLIGETIPKFIQTNNGSVILCSKEIKNYVIDDNAIFKLIDIIYKNNKISNNKKQLWLSILNEKIQYYDGIKIDKHILSIWKNEVLSEIVELSLPIIIKNISKNFDLFPENYKEFIKEIQNNKQLSKQQLLNLIKKYEIENIYAIEIVKQIKE